MTTVAEITGAIRRLPMRELAKFRKWFAEFDAAAWDRQFEDDVCTLDEDAAPNIYRGSAFASQRASVGDARGLETHACPRAGLRMASDVAGVEVV